MGDAEMTRGLDNWLSKPIGNGLLTQVAVDNAKSLFMTQHLASNQIATNTENMRNLSEVSLKLVQELTAQAQKNLQEALAVLEKQQASQKAGGIFGDIMSFFTVLGALMMGQPEIAAVSLVMFICQKTGATNDLEKAIAGNSPLGKILVGLGIVGLSALAGGGVSGIVRKVGVKAALGIAAVCTASTLPSVGLQENISTAVGASNGASIGIGVGFMLLSLGIGIGGGVAMAGSAKQIIDFGEHTAKVMAVMIGGGTVSALGSGSANIASAAYSFDIADARRKTGQAKALLNMVNEIQTMGLSQGDHFSKEMTRFMNEASREGVKVSEGMASIDMFASQLVAHA